MSSTSRSLLSLHDDVLLEILAHLLLDTPRTYHRAAVLQTCKQLYNLGVPLLYKVVNLGGESSSTEIVARWAALFGLRGTLTSTGKTKGIGQNVTKLIVGGPKNSRGVAAWQSLTLGEPDIPRCTTFVLERSWIPFHACPDLKRFIASLPIVHFEFHGATGISDPWISHWFAGPVAARLNRTGEQPWPNLETITMRDALWIDRYDADKVAVVPRIAFSGWSFKVLVVELGPQRAEWLDRPSSEGFFQIFLDPVGRVAGWWKGLERIELRIPALVQAEFRRRYADAEERNQLGALQKRILPLVVFVDEHGIESSLIA